MWGLVTDAIEPRGWVYERPARGYHRTLAALPRTLTARARMGVHPNLTIAPRTCFVASGVRLNGGRSRYSKILSVGMRSTRAISLTLATSSIRQLASGACCKAVTLCLLARLLRQRVPQFQKLELASLRCNGLK